MPSNSKAPQTSSVPVVPVVVVDVVVVVVVVVDVVVVFVVVSSSEPHAVSTMTTVRNPSFIFSPLILVVNVLDTMSPTFSTKLRFKGDFILVGAKVGFSQVSPKAMFIEPKR
jgi:hypothetical protein